MPDLAEIVAAIESGDLDGNLDPIADAVVARVRTRSNPDGPVEMAWRLRYDGDEWTEESVTAAELVFVESSATVPELIGTRVIRRPAKMDELDPATTAEHAVALLVAHLHKAQGVALADAVKRVGAISKSELVDIIGTYQVVRGPKDDGTSAQPVITSTTA